MKFHPVPLAAALIASATLLPGAALARGCADFDMQGAQVSDDYNPFNPAMVARDFSISVRKLSEDVDSVRFLLVDEDPRGGFPGFDSHGPENYDVAWIQDRSRKVLVTGQQIVDKTNSVFVPLAGPVGRAVNVSFQLLIPRGQESQAGRHRQGLAVRFSCYKGGDQIGAEYDQADQRVALALATPRFVSAYIGGVGQTRGQIDFGEVSPSSGDLSRNIAVTTIGTSPYEVRFDSENDGRLVRQTKDQSRGDQRGRGPGIRYAMTYGGLAVASGQKISCPVPVVPTGTTKLLDVTLEQGDVGRVAAGSYADTLTLTFVPRDSVWNQGCAIAGGGIK